MPSNLDYNKVKEFMRLFHHQYSEETLLPDICDVTIYQEKFSEKYGSIGNWQSPTRGRSQGHSKKEYNQIGEHSLMPIEILHSENPIEIIQSSARRLKLGERHYVINQLNQKAKDREIQTVEFDQPTHVDFQEWCMRVNEPNHLFLPFDSDFHSTVFEWRQRNDYNLNAGEVAISGNDIVKIHWLPLDSGFEDGYLFSSEGLNLVQKWFGDSPTPPNFEHDSTFDDLCENRPLMVYIGNTTIEDNEEEIEEYRKKVNFLYRIVVSELEVDDNHALRLSPTKQLSSE